MQGLTPSPLDCISWFVNGPVYNLCWSSFKIFDDPKRYDQTVSDGELGIRESHSAPLDEIASRTNTVTQREPRDQNVRHKASRDARAVSAPPFDPDREDSAKFQPFRNRNYKKKVVTMPRDDSDDSNDTDLDYVVHHKVKRGIKVCNYCFKSTVILQIPD